MTPEIEIVSPSGHLKPVFYTSVRDFVEFLCRTGGLGTGGTLAGPNRALEGTFGHQRVQRSRGGDYRTEVAIARRIETERFSVVIRGRIDGVFEQGGRTVVEEIKTFRHGEPALDDPLHWGQLKSYGYFHAEKFGLAAIDLQLTYLDLRTDALTEKRISLDRAALAAFFEPLAARYLAWIERQFEARQRRDRSIQNLRFPFPMYREGQKELIEAVALQLAQGGRLFVEAPTGVGKTLSVLFPAARAMADHTIRRLFYLTARTVGRSIAENAFEQLRAAGLELRTLTLVARAKLCVNNGQPCDPATCPKAAGYFDRREPAMIAAMELQNLNRATLGGLAHRHEVCPYALARDVAPWVDAIIGDYNHLFDPSSALPDSMFEPEAAAAFLIDEAHNLPDRAREMFSAALDEKDLEALAGLESEGLFHFSPALAKVQKLLAALTRGEAREIALHEIPEGLIEPLEEHLETVETWFAKNGPASIAPESIDAYFRLIAFLRRAEIYSEAYATLLSRSAARGIQLRLLCLDASASLRPILRRGRAAIFFSATLSPHSFYSDLLGGDAVDPRLALRSPFNPSHLRVLAATHVATHFQAREASLAEVIRVIAATVRSRRGNYLVYFPSHRYLEQAFAAFSASCPGVTAFAQGRSMTEEARDNFLTRFQADNPQTVVGFALLGGLFGEGIDLAGDRLVGVIVVGVGLPQICLERDLMKNYFEEKRGGGFDYAYLFPGMNRVLQASGRVIRSEQDRGVVVLIDSRFSQACYRALFPENWRPVFPRDTKALADDLEEFWTGSVAAAK